MTKVTRSLVMTAVMINCAAVFAIAQPQEPTETLLKGKTQLGFAVSPEMKFSKMNGEFAVLAGMSFGLVVKPNFLIGVAGYGKVTDIFTQGYMGYGGFILEYSKDPHRLVHYSIGGLVGAGYAQAYPFAFFVAEPQARVSLNLTRWFRLGFGGGSRFVAGAECASPWFRGPTANIMLMFGGLR